MVAFVAMPSLLAVKPRQSSMFCTRNAPTLSTRRLRVLPTMCAESGGSAESGEPSPPADTAEKEKQTPKEPYSGFYADMKRLGLSQEQAIAQAAAAEKRSTPVVSNRVGGNKNLYKPDGTLYAPWMGPMADYDPSIIKKRTDATGKLAADPQKAELSGVGLTWKMLGDELVLSWATGAEEGNVGFVVYRRATKEKDWKKIGDYRDKTAELATQGPQGGSYSFLVDDAKPGSWVYRVSDVDENHNVTDLSQVLVEIESREDSQARKIALVSLLVVLAAAIFLGWSLDPLSGT